MKPFVLLLLFLVLGGLAFVSDDFSKGEFQCKDQRHHLEMVRARAQMDRHIPQPASPQNKVIIFVVGPESTGNRYTVSVIISAAGCAGKVGHTQPLDQKARGRSFKKDWSALDERMLTTLSKKGTKCVVLHRSFPHNNHFVDLKRMARTAREKGFDPRIVVLTRVMPATIDSQIERKHVPNATKARENIKRAYLEIFDDVIDAILPFTVVTYEFLADKKYVGWMFEELGLAYDAGKIPSFHEANSKHLK